LIDSEFEKRGRAMSDELNQIQPIPEVDTEYTWMQEPQTMTHSDEVAQLRARIAELEREREALQKNLSSTEAFYVAAKERAEQAEAEAQHYSALFHPEHRVASKLVAELEQVKQDARLLAFAVQTGQRVEGLFAAASKYYVSPPPAQEYKKPRNSERA